MWFLITNQGKKHTLKVFSFLLVSYCPSIVELVFAKLSPSPTSNPVEAELSLILHFSSSPVQASQPSDSRQPAQYELSLAQLSPSLLYIRIFTLKTHTKYRLINKSIMCVVTTIEGEGLILILNKDCPKKTSLNYSANF